MTEAALRTGIPRWFEVIVAASGLAVSAPFIAIAGILIKTTSKGPVFFRQNRIGRFGKEFTLVKLRTMDSNASGSLVTAGGDGRVSRVGRLLRRSKIDELPELWNVLRGDMSLVGPRPEVPQLVKLNDPNWQRVLKVCPGLTDPVTLRLRNEENLLAGIDNLEEFYRDVLQPYKLQGYWLYLSERSWKTDVRIIALTFKAVLFPSSLTLPTLAELASFKAPSD